jgi:hypothetical protein
MSGRPRSTDPEVCKKQASRRAYREAHREEYNEYQRQLFIGNTERANKRREYMREYCRKRWRLQHSLN